MSDLPTFEKILLKHLTHNGEFFGKVMPIMNKKFFKDIGAQHLFELIKQYHSEYSGIPALTELVTMVKNVPNAGTRAEIIKSLQGISSVEEINNVEFLCNETVKYIKDALYLEALMIGSEALQSKDEAKQLKAQEILEERAKISIDTDLGLDFDDIDEMIAYYSERLVGIRTQHRELNKRLGPGFLPGTLSVVLAPGGGGKSVMMTDLLSGMIKEGKNILLVSLEMADKEIMKRVHANAMNLPINSLTDLSKTAGELDKIKKGDSFTPGRSIISKEEVQAAYNKMKMEGKCGKLFIKDYPTGSFSALMLEQLIESYKIEKDITFDIIFVDYLGIMKSNVLSPAAGLYSYIKAIGEEVRAVAQKFKLPIVSASQLNRGAVGATDADNSSISDSLGTAMTADFMLFLLQDEEMKTRGEIILKCTKNRFTGRTDTWLMNIDYEHMRFNDMLLPENNITAEDVLGLNKPSTMEDFGVITPAKQKAAEEFASQEIKDIVRKDYENLKVQDDPFKGDNVDDIFSALGI